MKQIGNPIPFPKIKFIIVSGIFVVLVAIIIIKFPSSARAAMEAKESSGTVFYIFLLMIYFLLLPFVVLTDKWVRTQFFNTKIGQVSTGLFHFIMMKFGKGLDQAEEILDEAHKSTVHEIKHERNMKDVIYYTEMAKANFYEAIGDTEKAKARILIEGAKYLNDMTPRWRAYVIACIMGSQGTKDEDADLQDEINRIKLEIELEALRTKKMENDERQRRHDANKKPPPDV